MEESLSLLMMLLPEPKDGQIYLRQLVDQVEQLVVIIDPLEEIVIGVGRDIDLSGFSVSSLHQVERRMFVAELTTTALFAAGPFHGQDGPMDNFSKAGQLSL